MLHKPQTDGKYVRGRTSNFTHPHPGHTNYLRVVKQVNYLQVVKV